MPLQVLALDESVIEDRFFGVGGIILAHSDISLVESELNAAKHDLGLDARDPVKWAFNRSAPGRRYERSWRALQEFDQFVWRERLIEAVARMPVSLLVVALEDKRGLLFKMSKKAHRSQAYIQKEAFAYALQRFSISLEHHQDVSDHFVIFDSRSDIDVFHERYQEGYYEGWPDLPYPVAALRIRRAHDSLLITPMSQSAVLQVADLTTGSAFQWISARLSEERKIKLDDAYRKSGELFARITPRLLRSGERVHGVGFVTHKYSKLHPLVPRWLSAAQS